jgi:thiamine pyrophosphokinase
MSEKTVILADGSFPVHEIPLGCLRNAERIVCCDGSVEALIVAGMEPFAVVGDMDSINKELISRFAGRIYVDDNQETNDLTKAVMWCRESGFADVIIVGATGKREDHTIGNISLLAEYIKHGAVKLITDTGCFLPFTESCKVSVFPGQQVSLFSIDPETEISSTGLLYPLKTRKLRNWWEGTLNEATGESFTLDFKGGAVIIFMKFRD